MSCQVKGLEAPSSAPEWLRQQKAAREDMAARREAYDAWAATYADSGVRADDEAVA